MARSIVRAIACAARGDALARDEERGLHRIHVQSERTAMLERTRYIGAVHEAVAHPYAPAVAAEPLTDHPLLEWHPRHVPELDGEERDPLMERLEMLQAVEQRLRRGIRRRGEIDGSARHALRR